MSNFADRLKQQIANNLAEAQGVGLSNPRATEATSERSPSPPPDAAPTEYKTGFDPARLAHRIALAQAGKPLPPPPESDDSKRYAVLSEPWDQLASERQQKSDASPITTSLKRGWNQMTDSVANFQDVASGNDEAVVKRMQEAQAYDRENPSPSANKQWNEDFDKGNTAAWLTNPSGFFGASTEQLANSLPSMAGSIPGMIGGAMAGAAVGGPAAPMTALIGGVLGGFLGSAPGSIYTEGGGRLAEMAGKDGVNIGNPQAFHQWLSDNRDKIIKEGLIKGTTTAAIDVAMMATGARIISGPAMAFRQAEARTLAQLGVNVADRNALASARQLPAYQAAMAPAAAEFKAATTVAKNAMRGIASFAGEMGGEGLGEYYGEKFATGEGNLNEALKEAVLAGGQASVTTAAQFAGSKVIANKAGLAEKERIDALAAMAPATPPARQPNAPLSNANQAANANPFAQIDAALRSKVAAYEALVRQGGSGQAQQQAAALRAEIDALQAQRSALTGQSAETPPSAGQAPSSRGADPLAARVDAIRLLVEGQGPDSAGRAAFARLDPQNRQELLSAWAIARNPTLDPAIRARAMAGIEQFIASVQSSTSLTAPNQTAPAPRSGPNWTYGQNDTTTAPRSAGSTYDGEAMRADGILPKQPKGRLPSPESLAAKRDADAAYDQAFQDLVKAEALQTGDLQAQQIARRQAQARLQAAEARLHDITVAIDGNRAAATQSNRRQILGRVLADPEIRDHAAAFRAALIRAGRNDADALADEEKARIDRFVALREAFAAPDAVLSAPNELDAATMGIRERQAKGAAGKVPAPSKIEQQLQKRLAAMPDDQLAQKAQGTPSTLTTPAQQELSRRKETDNAPRQSLETAARHEADTIPASAGQRPVEQPAPADAGALAAGPAVQVTPPVTPTQGTTNAQAEKAVTPEPRREETPTAGTIGNASPIQPVTPQAVAAVRRGAAAGIPVSPSAEKPSPAATGKGPAGVSMSAPGAHPVTPPSQATASQVPVTPNPVVAGAPDADLRRGVAPAAPAQPAPKPAAEPSMPAPARAAGRAPITTIAPPGTPTKLPLTAVKTKDGRTVHVLRFELNSPRPLLKLHDADGNSLPNQDGGFAQIAREDLSPATPAQKEPNARNPRPLDTAAPAPSRATQRDEQPGGMGDQQPRTDRGDAIAEVMAPAEKPKAEIKSDLDAKAHEAATSPLNDTPLPTDAMKEAGNYKLGHVSVQGLGVSIENPRGSIRSGTSPEGKKWQNTLSHHYGYFKGSLAGDGDNVDVFLTDGAETAPMAWVVDQTNKDGSFDELKVVLGPLTEADARAAYLANYDAGWNGLGAITSMPKEAFKAWISDGKTKGRPLAYVEPARKTITEKNAEKRHADAIDIGAQAFRDGAERTPPPAFTSVEKAKWLEGFDSAKNTPPSESVNTSTEATSAEAFPIANVRRPNGAIGTQGVTESQVADVLRHAAGMDIRDGMSMREMVESFKADTGAQQRLREFTRRNPVKVSAMWEGGDSYFYHLEDGHHRTFLLNQLGDETVPAVVAGREPQHVPATQSEAQGTVTKSVQSDTAGEGAKEPWQMTLAEFERARPLTDVEKRHLRAADKLFAAAAAKGFSEGGVETPRLTPKEAERALRGTGFGVLDFKTGLAGGVRLSDGAGMYSGQLLLSRRSPANVAGHAAAVHAAVAAGQPVPANVLADYPSLQKSAGNATSAMPNKFNIGDQVSVSGSDPMKVVAVNADGTYRVRNANGDEFDTGAGEKVTHAVAPKAANHLPPTATSRDDYIAARINELKSVRRAKLRQAIDAINATVTDKVPAGITKVAWLEAKSRPSKEEKALLISHKIAKENLEGDYRLDELTFGRVWDAARKGETVVSDEPATGDTQAQLRGADETQAAPARAATSDQEEGIRKGMDAWDRAVNAADVTTVSDNDLAGAINTGSHMQTAERNKAQRGEDYNKPLFDALTRDMVHLTREQARRIAAHNTEDLSAMFDDLMGELGASAEIPKAKIRNRRAEVRAKQEKRSAAPQAPTPRTAGQAAASAAKNTADGFQNAIAGLGKLFGGPAKLSMGLSFDEKTYEQARPLFSAAVANFKQAGADLKDVMRAVMKAVQSQFGDAVLGNMKPYIVRYVEDVRNGKVSYDENKEASGNDRGTESKGRGALAGVPAGEVEGAEGSESAGLRPDASGAGSGEANSRLDGARRPAGRGRGNRVAADDLSQTGNGRTGRGVAAGASRDGSGASAELRSADDAVIPAAVPLADYVIGADVALGSGGQMTKYRDNVAAIKLIKQLESERRRATPEEQRTLARYVGWGGIPNAFRNAITGEVHKDWAKEVAELESLLTPKELRAASASTPNAHYTAQSVVEFMWRLAARMGFSGGLVLEPSVGTGNFIGLMPPELRGKAHVTGIELDSLTARIAGALYPRSNIVQSGFEKLPLPDDQFDLAIGNPPFGKTSLRFSFKPEMNGASIHNQFFRGSMDTVKPGGLQIMVVSRFLMDAQNTDNRMALAKEAKLIGAIRLPGSAFKGNALTDVVTDILVLQRRTPEEAAAIMQALSERGKAAPKNESAKDRLERGDRAQYLGEAMQWVETGKVKDPAGGEPMIVNRYFAENPGMIAGTMDRSGSMQHDNDIDVKLRAGETLEQALERVAASFPERVATSITEEIAARTEERHRLLGEALTLYATGAEVGAIRFDDNGALTRVVERIGEDGEAFITKIALNENTPWSESLSIGLDGKWFRIVPKLDTQGNPVKVMKDGQATKRNVYVREVFDNDAAVPSGMRLGVSAFERLKALVSIRDLLVQQLVLETTSAPKEQMEDNRAKLRAAYDAFVKDHGFISEPKNAGVVADMPDEGLLLSLETDFKREVTAAKAKATGRKASPARAKPAAILSRPVGIPPARVDAADNIEDALALTLAETGRLDINMIERLRGLPREAVERELTDGDAPLAYADPEQGFALVDKNEYLSGNVRRKLEAARNAGLDKNTKALEAVQPAAWTSDQITPKLGGAWIPARVYEDFVEHLLGGKARVTFAPLTNSFQVFADSGTAAAVATWGTNRYPAPELLTDILNSRKIAVYDTDREGRHFNQTETDSALDKRREILEAFDGWVFKDATRRKLLTQVFNDHYNTRVNRQHDGSHMRFPGKVPDEIINLRRGQKNAIWRGIVENFVLYDHAVGAGKTFLGIARAMERRRMGLSKKPMIVVPNHLVKEWQVQALRLYPGAKVLAAGTKDLSSKNRRRLFAKIATGDWDLVIVPHSSFAFINLAPETEERFLSAELVAANQAMKDADAESGDSRFKTLGQKQAESLVKKIETRIDKLRSRARDKLLTFEQMGVDDLSVDEAHEFKNLQFSSNLTDVRGMGNPTGSMKALDLYMKSRVIHENGGSMSFFTGTPISNSAVEMYTVLRYLAPQLLEDMQLEHFDAFRLNFVDATTKFEPTDSGSGLKAVSRLGRQWSNMRSLMDAYYSVADVVTNEDIQAWFAEDAPGKVFPLPTVKGGGRQAVAVEPTPTQKATLDAIIARFDSLDSINDPKQRNAERLRLMDQARKVSLHAKAVNPSLEDQPGGKLDQAVTQIKRLYDKFNADKGTQLVFLDRSVPKSKGDAAILKDYDAAKAESDAALAAGDEEAFARANDKLEKFDRNEIEELRTAQTAKWNGYQHIKDGLVAAGVPADEIAFVQDYNNDADKKALFDAVNDGSIRVLIGSTPRMGAGTNVQQRLVGLHHVDVTWKPSDIEQREGRIIRQGNTLAFDENGDPRPGFEVEILAYVTKNTVDAKLWDLNSTKLRMINAIRYYDGAFEMNFDDEDAVGMAEIAAIASGDPLLLERFRLTGEVDVLYRQRRSFQRRRDAVADAIEQAKHAIERNPGEIQALKDRSELAHEALSSALDAADGRSLEMFGETFDGHMVSQAKMALHDEIAKQKGEDGKGKVSVTLNGEEYTSEGGAEEALTLILGDAEPFIAEVDGNETGRRSNVARAMREAIGSEFYVTDRGLPIGTILGIPAEVEAENGYGGRPVVVLRAAGKGFSFDVSRDISPDKWKSGQIVPVTVTGLRPLVTKFVEQIEYAANPAWRISDLQKNFDDAQRDLPELELQSKEEFKHAEELEQKTQRLREVEQELQARAANAGPVKEVAADGPALESRRTNSAPLTNATPETLRDGLHQAFGQPLIDRLESTGLLKIVATVDDLPEGVTTSDNTTALYDGQTAYIIANRSSPESAVREILHELGEHAGLETMLGAKGYRVLKNRVAMMAKTGNVRIQQAVAFVKANYPEYAEGSSEFFHEVLANIGQQADIQARPWWQDMLAAVRRWLVQLGYGGLIRAGDIQDMVLHSLKTANAGPRNGSGTAFSRAPIESTAERDFPLVRQGATVDGREVRERVPNMGSIAASLDNYTRLPGVREVPVSAFDPEYLNGITRSGLDDRTANLADEIEASGELNPLIVAVDDKGAYIIEGGHRFDALIALGAKSIPAVVVIDEDNPPAQQATSATLPPTLTIAGIERPTTNSEGRPIAQDEAGVRAFYAWFKNSAVVDAQGRPRVVYHGAAGERTVFEPYWKQLEREALPHELTGNGSVAQMYRAAKNEPEMYFFASERGTAESYGNDVVEAYLRIEAPAQGEDNAGAVDAMLESNADGARIESDTTSSGAYGGEAWVVRSGTQIKSINNRGTWDENSPNILLNVDENGDPSPEEARTVQAGLDGKNPIEAADWLADNAPEQYRLIARQVATKLRSLQRMGMQFGLGVIHPGDTAEITLSKARGATIPVRTQDGVAIQVILNGSGMTGRVGVSYRTALHELVHAATMQTRVLGQQGHPQFSQAVADLDRVADTIMGHMNARGEAMARGDAITDFERRTLSDGTNFLDTTDEIIAWALSDHEAQAYLESIPYRGQSLWSAFVQAVRKVLGLSPSADTALSEVLRISEVLLKPLPNNFARGLNHLDGRRYEVQNAGDGSLPVFKSPGGSPPLSWTGNRPDMDTFVRETGRPNILESRAGAQNNPASPENQSAGRRAVESIFGENLAKIGGFSRWLNTPLAIAKKFPAFNKLYRRVEDYYFDVSRLSNQAADLAPDLLPRIERLSDWKKKAPSNADVKAVSDALAEGTLYGGGNPLKGRIWSDTELRTGRLDENNLPTGFAPLNETQARLYRQAVEVVADAVHENGKSLVAKIAKQEDLDVDSGMSIAGMVALAREQVNERIEEAEFQLEILQDKDRFEQDLADLAESMDDGRPKREIDRALAKAKAEREKAVAELEAKIAHLTTLYGVGENATEEGYEAGIFRDLEAKTNGLIEHGYYPMLRFGEYAVYAYETDDKGQRTTKAFYMFEHQREAVAMAKQLKADFPDAEIDAHKMNKDAHKLFAGMDMATVEMFAEHLTDESGQPLTKHPFVQAFIAMGTTDRSHLKRSLKRKGVQGWSDDVPRVLAQFITSASRNSSGNYHWADAMKAAQDMGNDDLAGYGARYLAYVRNPQEEFAGIRSMMANWYILGSPAAAVVNLLQPLQTTIPWLTQHISAKQAYATTAGAWADYAKGKMSVDEKAFMKVLEDEGVVKPQEVHQLIAQAQTQIGDHPLFKQLNRLAGGKLPGALAFRKIQIGWGGFYSAAEQQNRGATAMAAYRVAKSMQKSGQSVDMLQFVTAAVEETQYTYAKFNRPELARGVGAPLMTFRQFTISYIEMGMQLYQYGKKTGTVQGWMPFMLMALTFLALSGMQGAPGADDAEDIIDTILQRMGYKGNSKQWLREQMEGALGKELGQFALHGVSSIPGMPIDISARMGMQNIVPGTSLFKMSTTDTGRDYMELLGPMGGLIDSAVEAGRGGSPLAAAPKAIKDAIQGVKMGATGEYRDRRGRKVIETDWLDAIWKGSGFQPSDVQYVQRTKQERQQNISLVKVVEAEIAEDWASAIRDRNSDGVKEAIAAVEQWNKTNPEIKIGISRAQVLRRANEMRKDALSRQAKTAPKEMRAALQ